MGIKKRYLKSKPVCKTKFTLPADLADGAETAVLVGEFNDWDQSKTAMKRLKNGSFTVEIDLSCGAEYQYRYLLDGQTWENDDKADKYAPSPFGVENSVVVVDTQANK